VLIILPPSESKAPPLPRGAPVDLDRLSFPALTPMRARITEALIETSARPDAFSRLQIRPTLAADVARNCRLLELPARPVLEVYTGPLHAGLDAATLSPAARECAASVLVVTSALWGALRPADRIPPYRLHICAELYDMSRLEPAWRTVLPSVLAEAAGEGVVLDLRSPAYQAAGRPTGGAGRTVDIRIRTLDERFVGDVIAKRVRGEAAHHLLESGSDPADPNELATVLGERWPLDLTSPSSPGKAWSMTLYASA
jgi:cytoplasmic iron level regulating protein YaaA (DUF328/UPF0246 family)